MNPVIFDRKGLLRCELSVNGHNFAVEKIASDWTAECCCPYLTKLRQDAFLEIRAGYVEAYPAPDKVTTWKDPARLTPEITTIEEVVSRRKRRVLWVIPARMSPAPRGPAFRVKSPPVSTQLLAVRV